MLKRTLMFLALSLALPGASAVAQDAPEGEVVDRVLAIVGDSVILQSQVEEEIQRMRLRQAPVPPPDDPQYGTFFNSILDEYINQVLILQAAAQDTLITPDESAIEQRVGQQIDQLVEQFGSRTALVDALASEGLTLAEYRDILMSQGRQQQIQQMYMQSRMRDARAVEVTEDELLDRFQAARGQLQQRPRLLTFHQVVVVPEASEDAMEEAREEAETILERIRDGEDFAQLARRYSDDPGSAELGGDLGWFRRGRMVQEFEDVAFSLPPGGVSGIVETDFGYHIIKVERSRPGERQGRHILVTPEKDEEDVERARQLAEQVAEAARGGAPMDSLYRAHSDLAAPDSLTMPFDQIGQLPGAYSAVRSAGEGEVVGPLQYEAQGESRFAVVKVEEIREAGAYTFEDVRGQLASQVQQQKQLERIIADLRERTYIEILR